MPVMIEGFQAMEDVPEEAWHQYWLLRDHSTVHASPLHGKHFSIVNVQPALISALFSGNVMSGTYPRERMAARSSALDHLSVVITSVLCYSPLYIATFIWETPIFVTHMFWDILLKNPLQHVRPVTATPFACHTGRSQVLGIKEWKRMDCMVDIELLKAINPFPSELIFISHKPYPNHLHVNIPNSDILQSSNNAQD